MRWTNSKRRPLFILALVAGTALAGTPATPAAAQGQSTSVPKIDFTERKLKNGLKVIAMRDVSTPNVMVSMWYDVGSKHDPDGRSGFAHLFEHILSRKTVNMPYNEINRMVDDVGGTRNASTWYDRTNYYETVPTEYLERMLWTHAERMARPVVDKEVFETERNVVKEELRQRVLAPPYGRLFSFVLGENVYNVLPHRRPTIGSISDLDFATLEDARAFHQAYYGPDTATLIVSGNFQPAELDRLVDKYFGAIPPRANKIPLAITIKERPIPGPRTVNASGPNVPLPAVGVAFQIPGEANSDMPALEVLNAILSRGNHNLLDTRLVKTGLAAEVESQFNNVEEVSYLALIAFAASGADPVKLSSEMNAAIETVRSSGVSADDVAEAKNELLAETLDGRQTADGRAFELGEALVRTGNPRHADERLAAITRVTAADVRRVAQTYLQPARRLDLRYVQGSGDEKSWANPLPLPKFKTVPPATGPGNQLRSEGEREAPPAAGQSAEYRQPVLSDLKLANGIRLVTARTGATPIATMVVAIRAGSATDGAAKAGRASLAAAIADKGTSTRSAEQIATALERLGATITQGVAPDATYLSVTAPTATLGEAAEILGEIAHDASFPEADFARERKRSLDGLSVALKDPGTLGGMLVNPIAYGTSPYGGIAAGTPESIAAMTRMDLLSFRQQYWRPELATVVVTGGIDADEAKAISERALAKWAPTGRAAPKVIAPAALAGAVPPARTIVVDLPGSGQAYVATVARGLSRVDPAFYDAQVANSVLGGSSTGRLFTEIRVKRALSYGAYSTVTGQLGEGTVVASAQTKNESAAEVVKVFLDELKRIGSEPLPADLIDKRKTLLTGAFRRSLQTSAGLSANIASAIARGIEPADLLTYGDHIGKVSGTDATAVMGRILAPERVSLVIVGDSAKFIDALRKLRPDAVVIPADKLDLAKAAAR